MAHGDVRDGIACAMAPRCRAERRAAGAVERRNSGERNSGERRSGERDSGERNSGELNSGERRSGNRRSGDRNAAVANVTRNGGNHSE